MNDADSRRKTFDEPAIEGSRDAPHGDPLAPDSAADVLSPHPVSDSRPRTDKRSGSAAGASSPARERGNAEHGDEHDDRGGSTTAGGADAVRSPASKTEDPNVLAMLDAILEMFPKQVASPDPPELSEPSLAARRSVEAESDRIPLHPGDDIFPGLSALLPSYRFPIILAYLLGAIGVSRFVPVDYPLRPVALALHIISLVIAFGAVLVIDWHGLLWLFGRRGLTESTRLAAAAGPLIWGGLFGLIASGALLHPNLSSPLTLTKLALVLMVAWNGAAMSTFRRRMAQLPSYVKPTDLPARDWMLLMSATMISQIGWWGAIIIGFVNSST